MKYNKPGNLKQSKSLFQGKAWNQGVGGTVLPLKPVDEFFPVSS